MPNVPIFPPPDGFEAQQTHPNPLPQLLQTPLGPAIVEIQGSLNLPASITNPPDGHHALPQIGRLVFPLLPDNNNIDPLLDQRNTDTRESGVAEGKWMKKAYLYIGHNQRLVGEVRRLAKPLAILQRKKETDKAPDSNIDTSSNEELRISEIAKWKLFFGGRPEFV